MCFIDKNEIKLIQANQQKTQVAALPFHLQTSSQFLSPLPNNLLHANANIKLEPTKAIPSNQRQQVQLFPVNQSNSPARYTSSFESLGTCH
mmetsp:Transcript_32044/g.42726  ORF Transcript_32044/g.42726 Transcript_32044/m.42726 type:complete len:91 (+) Transcript_32044:51-323(+)